MTTKFTVEIQYLLPVFQHITVEADSVEAACALAVQHDNWDHAREDYDSARETTVTRIAEGEHHNPNDAPGDLQRLVPNEHFEDADRKNLRTVVLALRALAEFIPDIALHDVQRMMQRDAAIKLVEGALALGRPIA